VITPGSNIAGVYSKLPFRFDYQFATHRGECFARRLYGGAQSMRTRDPSSHFD